MLGSLRFLSRHLGGRRAPIVAAVAAIVLLSPTIGMGLHLDDYVHQVALDPQLRLPGMVGGPTDVFSFVPADPEARRLMVEEAHGPWWGASDLQLAFWRPLSSLSHWLDHTVFHAHPALMHVHGLLWYAALVVAAGALYRRLMRPAWAAGLATALYAFDDGHALPATWLANRNATLAATFAVLAVLAHDRARRDGSRAGAALGPAALALGLLSGESALGAWGYLAAHAAFLDRAPWRSRLLALAPYLAVTVVWRVAYRALGFGVRNSGLYIDPLAEPAEFVRAAPARALLLLGGQLGPLPADVDAFIAPPVRIGLAAASLVFLACVAWALAPRLRRDPVARFWAAGMVLAVVPACATFANDRLLLIVGLGGMGLVARLIERLAAGALPGARRRGARALATAWVVYHVVIGPPLLLPRALVPSYLGGRVERAVASALAPGEALRGQTLVILNTSDILSATYVPIYAVSRGLTRPRRFRCLGISERPVHVGRPDATTLTLRAEGGFFGTPMDGLVRPRDLAFPRGYRVDTGDVQVEVTDVTALGRPAEVRYRFTAPLEDASFRWITWDRGVYRAYRPPAVGEHDVIAGAHPADMF